MQTCINLPDQGSWEQAPTEFKNRVSKTETCWNWVGAKQERGYGIFSFNLKNHGAHRFSYMLFVGNIPTDKPYVLHRCDNPSCVNPDHLWAGTHMDNMRDRNQKRRQALGLRNGAFTHPEQVRRGETHGMSKLTSAKVVEIRSIYANGKQTKAEIARAYGVRQGTIGNVLSGQTWGHVK